MHIPIPSGNNTEWVPQPRNIDLGALIANSNHFLPRLSMVSCPMPTQETPIGSKAYLTCLDAEYSSRPYITDLPPEIQLSIFDHLDPVASTCLGLSSKKLYPVHRSKHKKVGLFEGTRDQHIPLCFHLKNWAPQDLMLDWETEKLVSRERYGSLQKEREKKYWDAMAYNSGYAPQWQSSSRRHQAHQGQHEYSQPRLRKRRRMEKHDIWTFGRRLRSWAFD